MKDNNKNKNKEVVIVVVDLEEEIHVEILERIEEASFERDSQNKERKNEDSDSNESKFC